MKLTFLGGAGTVTGSKVLLESNYTKILIDCGLFQGLKELRLKNWDTLPINLNELNLVILSHAHLDHSGYIPILIKNGYKGKIYCTKATKDLTKIILLDSGKIQQEDAERANKYKYSKHQQANPLYTVNDAIISLNHFETFEPNEWHTFNDSIKFKFINSGHILGSVFILLDVNGEIFVFSGDIGRKKPILLPQYEYIEKADYVVIESTYGNRFHKNISILDELLRYIKLTFSKQGTLIIPTFSVERAQEIIYLLSILKRQNKLPKIPVYLDSPMGVNATEVYYSHTKNHTLTSEDINSMQATVQLISDVNTSKSIVNDNNPKIVLAGSGMITGGRVLHYLDKCIEDAKNSILIVGYQALGTRGRSLISGDSEIKFFGRYYKINAEVFKINAFSGHADQSELLDWLQHFKTPPKLLFINHGEPHQSQALSTKIKTTLNWKCTVAKMNKDYYLN
ncbi:MAG: MBL fold metallo-hydrolase [Lutibacter sp.]|uniref:MBL fold metallo-hydrolase RNA specificity domain-containing protein n=1 Tax=Lutibacter sp. TaxID=1925666 RepID=UPI0017F473C5|nr:MBL fold metallo-hydrolase [Lutibacter sp.]MBT8317177.1 MBL fold metallo-hydrolase [Lutibacter sp.]NNJ58037.1 MBL fold metallo-hydrolase [Lutibacter sp.]